MITRTSSSASAWSKARMSSEPMVAVQALRRSGRLSVIVRTPSEVSVVICSKSMTGRPLASFDCIDGVQGATIDELALADAAERWVALGFALSDGGLQLGRVRLAFSDPGAGRGIVSWSLRGIASTELDGLATRVS